MNIRKIWNVFGITDEQWLHLPVSTTLPWRNSKQVLAVVLISAAFYFSSLATGYTIVTAVSKILLAASIFLFIWVKLSQKM